MTIKRSLGEKTLSDVLKDRLVSRQLQTATFETIPYQDFETRANLLFSIERHNRLLPKSQDELKLLTCVLLSNREEILLFRMERVVNDAYLCY